MSYRYFVAAVAIGAALVLQPATSSAQASARADVTGKWLLSVITTAGTGTPTLSLTQRGDSLTGHYSSQVLGEADVKGSIKGAAITFSMQLDVQGTQVTVAYAGTVESSDAMKGTVDLGGQATGTFTGKRQ